MASRYASRWQLSEDHFVAGAGGRALPVLYQDECLLVVDKPAGLPSVATGGSRGRTAASEAQRIHRAARPVHRLDRETSGVMVFALDAETRDALERAFRERSVEKRYLALVSGTPRRARGTIDKPILDRGKTACVSPQGRPAVTHYRIAERFDECTLLDVKLETGRYNQVRLHFASVGHPLVGERKYARGGASQVRFRRAALHAASIEFAHPHRPGKVRARAGLPRDLVELMERLRA